MATANTSLENYMTMYKEMDGKNAEKAVQIDNLKQLLDDTTEKYENCLIKVTDSKTTIENLSDLIKKLETEIEDLKTAMIDKENFAKENLKLQLENQKAELEKIHQKMVMQQVSQLTADKDTLLEERETEIQKLVAKIKDDSNKHIQATNHMGEKAEQAKQAAIKEAERLNNRIELLQHQLGIAADEAAEKQKIIASHLATITSKESCIKTLEVDMADLFQKMVQCDKQIRNEMEEKYEKEKIDLESELDTRHKMELESLRAVMEREQDHAIAVNEI